MAKPANRYTWDTNGTNAIAPTAGHQSDGYQNGDIPASDEWNGLFANWSDWLAWLDAGDLEGVDLALTGDLTIGGETIASGTDTLTTSGGNDYINQDLTGVSVWYVSGASPTPIISGIAGGVDGRVIEVWNSDDPASGDDVYLGHDHFGSVAANRFRCPGNLAVTLGPGERAVLRYDANISRWRVAV